MEREPLLIEDNYGILMTKMAEGNPGAITVLAAIYREAAGDEFKFTNTLLHLDDMNIRGSQLWVAYKDFAMTDMTTLMEAIYNRDAAMVSIINKNCCYRPGDQKAVCHGASKKK